MAQGAVALGRDNIVSDDGTANVVTLLAHSRLATQTLPWAEVASRFGNRNNALTTGSIAIGDQAMVSGAANASIAIGAGAVASTARSVAIGDSSTTAPAVGVGGLNPRDYNLRRLRRVRTYRCFLSRIRRRGEADQERRCWLDRSELDGRREWQPALCRGVDNSDTDCVAVDRLLQTTASVATLSTSVSQLSNGQPGRAVRSRPSRLAEHNIEFGCGAIDRADCHK